MLATVITLEVLSKDVDTAATRDGELKPSANVLTLNCVPDKDWSDKSNLYVDPAYRVKFGVSCAPLPSGSI